MQVCQYVYGTTGAHLASSHSEQMGIGSMLALGAVVTFLPFWGLVLALGRSRSAMFKYSLIMFWVFLGQALVCVIAYQATTSDLRTVRIGDEIWSRYKDDQRVSFQTGMVCCGYMDISDRPGSTCPGTNYDTELGPCYGKFQNYVSDSLVGALRISIIAATIELSTLLMAIVFARITPPE